MQDLVGIVRTESEMQEALDGLQKLKQRAKNVSVTGNVDFNPGWHTALDLRNLLTVSEAITRAALAWLAAGEVKEAQTSALKISDSATRDRVRISGISAPSVVQRKKSSFVAGGLVALW